jgi:predicted nucleic acid-binding protein
VLEPLRRPLRIYADTSVFGGCFDKEFERPSRRFFEQVHRGRIILLFSEVVRLELFDAPPPVRAVLASIPVDAIESVALDVAALFLRDAYLAGGVVGPGAFDDASHVAIASAAEADAIVSWNFKDIVNLGRIAGYNRVNARLGYRGLTILTPQGVPLEDEH